MFNRFENHKKASVDGLNNIEYLYMQMFRIKLDRPFINYTIEIMKILFLFLEAKLLNFKNL